MTSPAPATRPALRPLEDALAELLSHATRLTDTEAVDTFEADGRVLAAPVLSALDVPGFDNSSMDGWAVRCAEVPAPGAVLRVTDRIPAGHFGGPLAAGGAARIFTGAPVPEGADAVVMQEDAELLPGEPATVRIQVPPRPGQWIRRRAEDIARGQVVLEAGTRLAPQSLGLAASIGLRTLQVVRQPRVALFSTGDELVMPGDVAPEAMPPGAIYNSNRFFLRALLQRMGCVVSDLGIVPDRRDATIEALREASAAHDLILTSGGVSVGEEDHIKPAVQALGQLSLWSLAMKPGKPFAYGRVGPSHFIGLPGNPVSSFVTFVLLVRPFVLALQGAVTAPQVLSLQAGFDWPRPDRRREFLRARRSADGRLELFPNQSSGVLTSTTWAEGLIDNPGGQVIARGETVRFLPFAALLS